MPVPRRTHANYLHEVMDQLMGDLHYPAGQDGTQINVDYCKTVVAHHLVKLGWRKPNNSDGVALWHDEPVDWDDPLIKKRKVYGPGVFEDAIRWVSVNEPDDPLADLDDMSQKQINALPEELRIEAKRRLGQLPAAPEPDPDAGWHTKTFINIQDEPDHG